MASGVKKGFISDAEMDRLSSSVPIQNRQSGFISDSEMDELSKPKAKPKQTAAAALEGFGEGATLGYLNNLQALADKPITAIGNFLTGNNVEADDYLTARDNYNRRQAELQRENPAAFGAGQIAGTIASSMPVAKAAQGATVAARALQGAKAGAIYGGLQNTQEREGELGGLDLPERIESAGVGLALGAGSSLAGDAIGKGMRVGAKSVSAARNKIGERLKKSAEQLAENATGATRVQAEKFRDGSGRYLLDNKLVGFGDTAETIAEKAGASIKKSEDAIDASLKTLDKEGVRVSQDKIVENLQAQIEELSKDPSKSDVVRKLSTIIDDIIETGESEIKASTAEETKRGFNRMAKNWQDPEKGQAGKIAYRAYRDAVEETASTANPGVAKTFKEGKETFGRLAPIVDAAEKRARQLNQHPLGGLLDTAAVIGGAASSDDPLSGGITGLGAAIARRKISPRLASSVATSFDAVSRRLLRDPQISRLAQVNPEGFRATVFSLVNQASERPQVSIPRSVEDQPQKGPEKWARDGVNRLIDAGVDQESAEALLKTKAGKDLLIEASDAPKDSARMKSVLKRIKSASTNGGE